MEARLATDSHITEGLYEVRESHLAKAFALNNFYFVSLKRNHKTMVLRAGSFIDESQREKYLNSKIYIDRTFSNSIYSKLKEKFEVWANAQNEPERVSVKNDFISLFKKNIVEDGESFIHYCHLFYENFHFLDSSELVHQSDESLILTQRALVVSSLVVLTAMLDGVTDFSCLRDLYNVSFHLDTGLLADKSLSLYLIQACEKERVGSKGIDYLRELDISENKLDLFLQHPHKSYEYLLKNSSKFTYPELIHTVKYHQERRDGSGFPLGINYSVLNNFEQYMHYIDALVPFDLFVFEKKDLSSISLRIMERNKRSVLDILWRKALRSES